MDFEKIKRELDQIKIRIGVEKKLLSNKEKELENLGIKTTKEAKQKIKELEKKITIYTKKLNKIKKEVEDKLFEISEASNED